MWKILAAASTAVALFAAPAFADMADWDANTDSMIDRDEFGTGFGEGGVFGDWDTDDDAMLTEDEWSLGWGDDYDEADYGAFSDWDANQDTFLDEDEFGSGVFGTYDTDDDDLWTDEEYTAFEDDDWF